MEKTDLQNLGCQYLPDILTEDEVSEVMKSIGNIANSEPKYDDNRGTALISYSPKECGFLMKKMHSLMEKNIGEELLPSYWFFTVYYPGAYMSPHKDRFSCEVSLSLNLQSTGTSWPLQIYDYYGNVQQFCTPPGSAVAYLGTALEHWREPLKCEDNEKHIQLFLHYVRKNGSFTSFAYDEGKCHSILGEIYGSAAN